MLKQKNLFFSVLLCSSTLYLKSGIANTLCCCFYSQQSINQIEKHPSKNRIFIVEETVTTQLCITTKQGAHYMLDIETKPTILYEKIYDQTVEQYTKIEPNDHDILQRLIASKKCLGLSKNKNTKIAKKIKVLNNHLKKYNQKLRE